MSPQPDILWGPRGNGPLTSRCPWETEGQGSATLLRPRTTRPTHLGPLRPRPCAPTTALQSSPPGIWGPLDGQPVLLQSVLPLTLPPARPQAEPRPSCCSFCLEKPGKVREAPRPGVGSGRSHPRCLSPRRWTGPGRTPEKLWAAVQSRAERAQERRQGCWEVRGRVLGVGWVKVLGGGGQGAGGKEGD